MIQFDTMMLACAVRGIEERAVGAKVERITQPAAHATQWTLYAGGVKATLLIETDAASSRMHLTTRGRQSPHTPPAFCMLLRKLLGGAVLEGVERPLGQGERVVRLIFAAPDRRRYSLYAELMGRHGNQILVDDAAERVLGAIKWVSASMSRVREVRAGTPYQPVPRPRGVKRDVFAPGTGNGLPPAPPLAGADEAERWLMQHFSGLSPLMAREGVARRPDASLSAESLWFGVSNLVNHVRLTDYSPVLLTDELGRIVGAYPVTLRTVPGARQPVAPSFEAAVDDAADALERSEAFTSEKTALVAALRRARRIVDKESLDIAEGLANSERADEYRTCGQLIVANKPRVAAGSDEAVLIDYASGEEVAIGLDPALTAQENADRYFRKYEKARDARVYLEKRQVETAERAARIDDALPRAEAARAIETVQALAQQLDDIREMADPGPAGGEGAGGGKEPPDPFAGYKIRTYRSVDGWEILVGENAESNDYLTTRVAGPSDIWLHARSQTSAHAVIRARNRPAAVSPAALRYAAEQVARRSTSKHSRLVPVDYTLRKYVRKPRGSKPGQVLYSREKTLDVVPEG